MWDDFATILEIPSYTHDKIYRWYKNWLKSFTSNRLERLSWNGIVNPDIVSTCANIDARKARQSVRDGQAEQHQR